MHAIRQLFTCLPGLLFLLATLSAAAEAPPGREFEFTVRELVFRGLEGDVEALERAVELCDRALAENSGNAEALVWRGSASLMLSGVAYRAGNFAGGSSLWQTGLDEMARAVELAPSDVSVLIPRAAALLGAARAVPFPQQAHDLTRTAVGDYERVYELQKPYFGSMSEHARGELLLGLADAHHRLGQRDEAARYLREIRSDLAETPYADEAAAYLDGDAEAADREIRTCHGCHARSKGADGE